MIPDINKLDDITPDMYDALNAEIEKTFEEGCHGQCASCEGGCEPDYPRFAKRLYAVTGGKGGTGKSTVTALLAVALARRGLSVALLDADISGATLPHLLGAKGPMLSDGDKLQPLDLQNGIRLLSFNLVATDLGEPVLWPGADTFNVVNYFYTGAQWGEPDVMLVDMPSGAGDVPINLYSALPVDGTIIVTEPSGAAVVPTARCINMVGMLMSAPVAFVENKALTAQASTTSHYTLPERCLIATLPLSAEIAAAANDGTVASFATPAELVPLVDQIAAAVDSKKKA